MRAITLRVDNEKLAVAVFESEPAVDRPGVLLLHGGGPAGGERLYPVAEEFAARGVRAVVPDFSGHGASSGSMNELSLERRHRQACAVIESCCDGEELRLLGFSMSGQTVGDLLGTYGPRVAAIGLCAPAVYTKAAWHTPFDSRFTTQIRVQGAWADSGALENFERYPGRAVLVLPESDAVIPPAVSRAVTAALSRRATLIPLSFPGSDHQLGRWLGEHAEDRSRLADALLRREVEP